MSILQLQGMLMMRIMFLLYNTVVKEIITVETMMNIVKLKTLQHVIMK